MRNASITLNMYAHVMAGDDERVVDLIDTKLRSALAKQGNQRAN
jgi:hypothetical protein